MAKKDKLPLEDKQKETRKGCSGCLVVFILFILVVALFSCVGGSSKSDKEKWADEREDEFDMVERNYDELMEDLSNVRVMEPLDFINKMDDTRDYARYMVDELNEDYGNSDPVINKIKKEWQNVGMIAMLAADGIRTNNVEEIQSIEQYKDDYKHLKGQINSEIKTTVRYSKLDKAQQEEWVSTLEQDKAAIEQLYNTEMAPDQKAAQAREYMALLEQQTNAIQDATGYNQTNYPLIRAYVDVREMAVAIKHMAENDDYDKFAQEYPECVTEATDIINEIKSYLSEQE